MADLPISGLPAITVVSSSYLLAAVSESVTAQMTVKQVGDAYSSSLSGSFVPYTGATANVNLGAFDITSGDVFTSTITTTGTQPVLINGSGTENGGIAFKHATTQNIKGLNYTNINASGTTALLVNHGTGTFTNKSYLIQASGLTDDVARTYTLPDASGTIALLSDITGSSIFPYTGSAQITGSLGVTGSLDVSGSMTNGFETSAPGLLSHAEGSYTIARGLYSHAEGQAAIASGSNSHAEGQGAIAFGDYSHAEGYYTIARGLHSHAEGSDTLTTRVGAHAEGTFTTASGNYSHAEGTNTFASGSNSHAEGSRTTTIGNSSHAEGTGSIASGSFSHAEGRHTIASGSGQHTQGQFNLHGNTTSLMVIGDGIDDTSRHDLVRAEVGSFQISGSLNVTGSISQTNVTSSLVKADANGTLVAATVGQDYTPPAYLSAFHTASLTVTAINTPCTMSFSTTDFSFGGITISGSFSDKIKIANGGVYNLQFSAATTKTTGTSATVDIWLRKNESDLSYTNTIVTLAGGSNDFAVPAWNFFVSASAGDYYQLMFASPTTNPYIAYSPSGSTGIAVQVPSVILTVNRIA